MDQKNIYFCFIDYTKTFECVDHNKLWKNSPRDGNTRTPDLPPEKSVCRSGSRSVRARHGTVDWYQIGKGVCQGCILSPCLFNLFAESVQLSLVVQSCSTLCNPMNRSTPGLPVHHQLPEFTQTHVRWVSDAIQTSHPLLSPSSPTFNLSKHQGLFK